MLDSIPRDWELQLSEVLNIRVSRAVLWWKYFMLSEKIFCLAPVLIAPLSLNSHRSRTSTISCILYWFHLYGDMLETMIQLWLSAVSELAVAVAHYMVARCCWCLPSVHSISCRWPHLHQGRHLWHQPSLIFTFLWYDAMCWSYKRLPLQLFTFYHHVVLSWILVNSHQSVLKRKFL